MAELLKNLIDRQFIEKLTREIEASSPKFESKKFTSSVLNKSWKEFELKQRIRRVVECLNETLPGTYPQKIEILSLAAPQFSGLGALIFPDFVDVFGREHWDVSVGALKRFTPYSTSEFAVRPFIELDQKKMLATMTKWSKDKDPHVRRLSSEGCRPRLPWSFKLRKLVEDPMTILPILENLKADESLYVRKSVANNLNDISKDHPELVIDLAKRWLGKDPNTDWILKHALRTLLKKGDQRALKLFGLGKCKHVEVKSLILAKRSFAIGTHLQFSFELSNKKKTSQILRLEYAIHYRKKNGTHNKKVFKITERHFESGLQTISRKHSLKQMSTRIHYPGKHHIDLIINGEVQKTTSFTLV